MAIPDDAKRQALEAAQNVKLAGDIKTLPTSELGTGAASSPTTVGTHPPGYGKDMNPIRPEPTPGPDKQ